ncbi:unnamed protein product [Rhizophagus irregularis]|nr:unnamed protein product [Rhizophagus irregularis]
MADTRRLPVLKIVTSALGGIPLYTGQEPPDKYIDTLIQSWAFAEGHMTALENANAGDFDNAVKCTLLKSKMGGKYAPVPANNGLVAGNPAINTPNTLRAWLRAKYQRETVGNQQSAIQRLTQKKFQQYDTSDTYETRIRPLLLGVADNDVQVLGFLKSQLSGELYTWMRIANPAGIDVFFTELKNMWLERPPNLNGEQTSQNNSSAKIENFFESTVSGINAVILIKNWKKGLGVIEINLAKLTKLIREDIVDIKSTQKDTRSAKSSQHQRSESSPFGGLEKRLGQIEALLAKLTRNSKSRSGRVHMATADEQSDPIFSDDDISKPEDNDYNSDNSFVESDSGNRVKQDSNSSPVHNASPDWKKKDSQIEFKNLLPYMIQQAKNYEPALAQDKSVKSKGDDFSELVSVVSKSDEKIPELSDNEDILDGPMEIDFVQKKEPTTSIATMRN